MVHESIVTTLPGATGDTRPGRLYLFGPMRVESDDGVTAVARGDAQRLVAYLALHRGTTHRREVLAEALWPGHCDASRRVLSDTLYRLRRHLGAGWFVVDADTIGLSPDVIVDAAEFDRRAASADRRELELAVSEYGELVPGVYDDWALEQRAARHGAYVSALRRSVAFLEQDGDLERAVRDARRLITAEPLDEPAHQTYLRLLGRLQRYGEALAHYESFGDQLAIEMGVAPLPSTSELVDRLHRERLVAAAAPSDDSVRFVGRVVERARALDAIDAALAGRGSIVCVEGVAGIGKTRLLEEIADGARWRGAVVSHTEVSDVPEASSLSPLTRVLGPLMSPPVCVQAESELDPMLLRMLAWLHPEWRAADDAAAAPDPDGIARLRNALSALGGLIARSGNIVVMIDDLHWGSTSLWDQLTAFTDGFVPGGGVLVAAYRRPDVEPTPGWPVLQAWDRRGFTTFLPLQPFEPDEIAELVGGDATPAADVLAVTGGIPFHVRQWLSGSDGDRSGGGNALIRGRLEALDPAQRRALECAAVVGEPVSFRAWAAVAEMAPLGLGAISERLVADRWLRVTESGHVFTHDLLREAVDAQLGDTERASLHGRTADVLAGLEPHNARTRAYHLDHAGKRLAAGRAYCESGRALRASSAFADAQDAWRRALELLPPRLRRERLDVALDLAEICDATSDYACGTSVLREAVELARELGDEASLLRALLLASNAATRTGAVADAERLLTDATPLAERLGEAGGIADVLSGRALVFLYTGRELDARHEYLAGLDAIGSDDDPERRRRLLRGVAACDAASGRLAEAVAILEHSLTAHRDEGDRWNELRTAINLMNAYYELGAWDRLQEVADATLQLGRRLGDPVAVGLSWENLALIELATGDCTRARTCIDEAEVALRRADRKRLVGMLINVRGLIAEDDGEPDEAMELYTAALRAARAIDAGTEEAYASHDLGALLCQLGRPEDAVELLRTSVAHWAELGNDLNRSKSEAVLGSALLSIGESVEAAELATSGLRLFRAGRVAGEHPQVWLWSLFQLLDRLGRAHEAVDVLVAARQDLVRQAASIGDPERRRRFFECVPVNRAIVSAFESQSPTMRTIVVELASVAAPLGRTLRQDERVRVHWSLDAADDESIDDRAARRRHRLQRLLDEAAAQGGSPTDDDLADALGVSRRTILRDMTSIGERSRSATRRRGRSRPRPDEIPPPTTSRRTPGTR